MHTLFFNMRLDQLERRSGEFPSLPVHPSLHLDYASGQQCTAVHSDTTWKCRYGTCSCVYVVNRLESSSRVCVLAFLLTDVECADGSFPQGMLWETSLLDAEEGIRFRGYSIPELQVRTRPGHGMICTGQQAAKMLQQWQNIAYIGY